MIKVMEFMTKEILGVDDQINLFLEKNNVEFVDVKYHTFLDTYHNIIMSSALLIYKET